MEENTVLYSDKHGTNFKVTMIFASHDNVVAAMSRENGNEWMLDGMVYRGEHRAVQICYSDDGYFIRDAHGLKILPGENFKFRNFGDAVAAGSRALLRVLEKYPQGVQQHVEEWFDRYRSVC